MRYLLILSLLFLFGCDVDEVSDLKKGDEILVRRYEGFDAVWDRLSLTDVQGNLVQYAGNPRYFDLSEKTWKKVKKAEAE